MLRVVLADTEIFLANLVHAKLVTSPSLVAGLEFIIPEEALATISRPDHRAFIKTALAEGPMQSVRLEELAGLIDRGQLCECASKAEATCLALVSLNPDWLLASDQRGAFRRILLERIDHARVLTTPRFILHLVRTGALTVEAADAAKAVLEARRFRMAFRSFRDLLSDDS